MPKLPRLKIKWWSLGTQEEEMTCEFEQAKEVIFGNQTWILAFAEGEMINSYDDLVKLATREEHKDKEVLNITLLVPGIGGG